MCLRLIDWCVLAYSPVTMTMHYGMTKVAIANLSVGFAELTKGTEVTVNTFHSGPTATENVLSACVFARVLIVLVC